LADKTIIVFISVHGYLLGEHQCWQKMMLFEEACRVPTIYVTPDMKNRASTSRSIVEHVDIYPTIAELARLTPDRTHSLEGKSLVPILNDPNASVKSAAFTQLHRAK